MGQLAMFVFLLMLIDFRLTLNLFLSRLNGLERMSSVWDINHIQQMLMYYDLHYLYLRRILTSPAVLWIRLGGIAIRLEELDSLMKRCRLQELHFILTSIRLGYWGKKEDVFFLFQRLLVLLQFGVLTNKEILNAIELVKSRQMRIQAYDKEWEDLLAKIAYGLPAG